MNIIEAKFKANKRPLITIITATLNSKNLLNCTIKSIKNQSYKNIEWIIIDCLSKDGLLELINKNKKIINFFLSEKDTGIYDAWNKGLKLSKGEWICFVGSGDALKKNAFLSYVNFINANPNVNLISSKINIVDENKKIKKIIGQPYIKDNFLQKMTIAHVGALHHKSLLNVNNKFDDKYQYSGDYEFLLRNQKKIRPGFIDVSTASMLAGGKSSSYPALCETYKIQIKYIGFFKSTRNFFIAVIKFTAKKIFLIL